MADLQLLRSRVFYNTTQYPHVPHFLDECTIALCPLSWAFVHYVPSLAGNVLFLALFGAILVPQMYLAARHRTLGFGIAIFMGVALEIVGYVARVQMHANPFRRSSFLIYLICLTLAPVFLTAGIYLCLGRIVIVFDPEEKFTMIKARSYMLIFCACDLVSLVLQAIGGGMAAEAANGSPELHTGTHIMVAGLAIQVASLLLFASFCLDFGIRVQKRKSTISSTHQALYHSRHFKIFLISLGLATLFIFIRSVFRVAELSGGFGGKLANNQISFMVLDGTMVILACFLLTAFHPGTCFKGTWQDANFYFRSRKSTDGGPIVDEGFKTKSRGGLFARGWQKGGEKSPAVPESLSNA